MADENGLAQADPGDGSQSGLETVVATAPAGETPKEGYETAQSQAYDRMNKLDELYQQRKAALTAVPWAGLAAGFLNPGRTGSFGEGLGHAMANWQAYKDTQNAAIEPLIKQMTDTYKQTAEQAGPRMAGRILAEPQPGSIGGPPASATNPGGTSLPGASKPLVDPAIAPFGGKEMQQSVDNSLHTTTQQVQLNTPTDYTIKELGAHVRMTPLQWSDYNNAVDKSAWLKANGFTSGATEAAIAGATTGAQTTASQQSQANMATELSYSGNAAKGYEANTALTGLTGELNADGMNKLVGIFEHGDAGTVLAGLGVKSIGEITKVLHDDPELRHRLAIGGANDDQIAHLASAAHYIAILNSAYQDHSGEITDLGRTMNAQLLPSLTDNSLGAIYKRAAALKAINDRDIEMHHVYQGAKGTPLEGPAFRDSSAYRDVQARTAAKIAALASASPDESLKYLTTGAVPQPQPQQGAAPAPAGTAPAPTGAAPAPAGANTLPPPALSPAAAANADMGRAAPAVGAQPQLSPAQRLHAAIQKRKALNGVQP